MTIDLGFFSELAPEYVPRYLWTTAERHWKRQRTPETSAHCDRHSRNKETAAVRPLYSGLGAQTFLLWKERCEAFFMHNVQSHLDCDADDNSPSSDLKAREKTGQKSQKETSTQTCIDQNHSEQANWRMCPFSQRRPQCNSTWGEHGTWVRYHPPDRLQTTIPIRVQWCESNVFFPVFWPTDFLQSLQSSLTVWNFFLFVFFFFFFKCWLQLNSKTDLPQNMPENVCSRGTLTKLHVRILINHRISNRTAKHLMMLEAEAQPMFLTMVRRTSAACRSSQTRWTTGAVAGTHGRTRAVCTPTHTSRHRRQSTRKPNQ